MYVSPSAIQSPGPRNDSPFGVVIVLQSPVGAQGMVVVWEQSIKRPTSVDMYDVRGPASHASVYRHHYYCDSTGA